MTSIIFNPAVENILKNCIFVANNQQTLTLNLDKKFSTLLTDSIKIKIDIALKNYFKSIIINLDKNTKETLAQKEQNLVNKKKFQAQQKFLKNEVVIAIQEIFETKFETKSIKHS